MVRVGHRFAPAVLVAVCAVVAALVSAAPAGAHAFLVRSTPGSGATVMTAPPALRLYFTEPVRPAPGITVVRAGGHPVMAGKPYVPASNPREIVVPLRKGLGQGPYAVRWAEVDVEDGHLIAGAFIFSIGAGLPPVRTTGAATEIGGSPPLSAVISRWLEIAGLLVAAGIVAFDFLLARRDHSRATEALAVAASLAVTTLGAILAVVFDAGSTHTRFGHWTIAGACVAAAAAALAFASRRLPLLWPVAGVLAVALLGLPTATGHASAAGVSHALSIPADLAHLAAAAVWLGGVVELAVLVPRDQRATLARRFTPVAVVAVALLGATGIVRAYNELDAVHQAWSTGYGQALLVKTGLFAALLVLGWLNRGRLRNATLGAELVLLAVVIGAVAVLTNVRPGISRPQTVAATVSHSKTVIYAGEDGALAVGLAVTPHGTSAVEMKVTVLGQNGPRNGLAVRVGVDSHDSTATHCGLGCYAATLPLDGTPKTFAATVTGTTLRFSAPSQWPAPDGLPMVRAAEQEIRGLKTMVVRSHLASDPQHAVTTIYKMVAPDRLSYHNIGSSDSIIIGTKRWDRQPGQQWVESPQLPAISQPSPFWPEEITDAHVLRMASVHGKRVAVVSFLDPATPAWFTAWIDPSTDQTLRLDMVAAAHFMHDVDGPFDGPVSVEPPGR